MLKRDYIVDMIEEFFRAIGQARQARKELRFELAREALDELSEQAVGLKVWTLAGLSMEDLLERCSTAGQLDPARCALLAELTNELAALQEAILEEEGQTTLWVRALALFDAAWSADSEGALRSGDRDARVQQLLERVAAGEPAVDSRLQIFRLEQRLGRFDRAEDQLFHLLDLGWSGAYGLGEGFYASLLALDDQALEAGNLPRDELSEGLGALRAEQQG